MSMSWEQIGECGDADAADRKRMVAEADLGCKEPDDDEDDEDDEDDDEEEDDEPERQDTGEPPLHV